MEKEDQAKSSIRVMKAPDRAEETRGEKHQWHDLEENFPELIEEIESAQWAPNTVDKS